MDKIAEVDSASAQVGTLSIPYNDYDRQFVSNDEEDEFSFKFTKYSPDKQKAPISIFMSGVGENMPIKDYETFKNEKN